MQKEMKKNKRFYLTTFGKSIFRTPHLLFIISDSIEKLKKFLPRRQKLNA